MSCALRHQCNGPQDLLYLRPEQLLHRSRNVKQHEPVSKTSGLFPRGTGMPGPTVCWSDRASPLVLLSGPFCLSVLPLCSDWPVRNPGVRGTMHWCPEAQLAGSDVWSPPSIVPASAHSLAWPQLWRALGPQPLDFNGPSHLVSVQSCCCLLPTPQC